MQRINVYTLADEYGYEPRALEGWFDLDKAERFAEDTDWNGSNQISVNTGSEWDHEEMYRTAQGRWVHSTYSNRDGASPDFTFATDEFAREWLLKNREDEAVAKYFGPVEEERGPGRPAVGDAINVRLGDELLAMVDEHAGSRGISRAEAIRRLVQDAVTRARVAESAPLTPAVNR